MEGRLSSHKRNQATVLTKGPSPHTFTRLFLPRAYFQAPTVSPFCVPAFAARGFSLSARLHERVSGRTLPVAAGPFAPTGPLAKRPCPRNGPQHRAPLAVRNAGRTRVRRDHPPAKEQRRRDIAAEACSGRFRVAAAGGPWRSWSDAAPPPLPSCRPRSAGPPCPKPGAVATGDALRNGPPRDGALRHIAVHKLQSSMDGFLSRFTPKLRKMRSIKSQWHMWKPARRQSVRTAHEAPADGRKEDENAAAEK